MKKQVDVSIKQLVITVVIVLVIGFIFITPSEPKKTIVKQEVNKTKKIIEKKNENIGKTFTIDHKKSFDIDGYNGPVNLWASFDNRTLTGEVKRYDKVELLELDKENYYCKVKKDKKTIGWCLCDWLEELPQEMKSMKTS